MQRRTLTLHLPSEIRTLFGNPVAGNESNHVDLYFVQPTAKDRAPSRFRSLSFESQGM